MKLLHRIALTAICLLVSLPTFLKAEQLDVTEVQQIVEATPNCCEIVDWVLDSPEIYGDLNYKYELPDGSTVYIILTDHGASLPYHSLIVHKPDSGYHRLLFEYPNIHSESELAISILEEVPHLRFDAENMEFKTWSYWRAGDNSQSAYFKLSLADEPSIRLVKFTADYVDDGKVTDHVVVWSLD